MKILFSGGDYPEHVFQISATELRTKINSLLDRLESGEIEYVTIDIDNDSFPIVK
jgi:hypothetical protein